MVTISHVVSKLIDENIYLQEAIGKGIASYGSVAKKLKAEIEAELSKEVAHYAIVAAIRRYAERMEIKFKDIKFDAESSEVNLKTNLIDITVLKTHGLFDKLKHIYDIISFDQGDLLHIIYGRNSVNIVTNERYKDKILNFLQHEKVVKVQEKLVSLSFSISKRLMETPGVLFKILRDFAWENINIIEVISIDLEISLIVSEKNVVRGYKALERLIE